MSTDQVDLAVSAPAAETAPEPYSAEWWQARTAKELRDIINQGYRAGQAYDSAVAETERRAREALRRVRDEQSATARRNARTRLMVLAAVLAGILAIGFFDWMFL